ncbi:MAG: hypothetical protein HYX97_04990, partial [Chloroflexi bacterium]|nr:hypothetical protein [Chloroflexota bacterium]
PDPHSAWADLVDELGLRDYLAQRFAIAGTAQDWAQRLRELSRYGVRKVVMAGAVPDIGAFVTRLGREVISAHRS